MDNDDVTAILDEFTYLPLEKIIQAHTLGLCVKILTDFFNKL